MVLSSEARGCINIITAFVQRLRVPTPPICTRYRVISKVEGDLLSCAAFTLWNRSNVIRCSIYGSDIREKGKCDLRKIFHFNRIKERKCEFVYMIHSFMIDLYVRKIGGFLLEKRLYYSFRIDPSWKIRKIHRL